jgi:hypothetical protein
MPSPAALITFRPVLVDRVTIPDSAHYSGFIGWVWGPIQGSARMQLRSEGHRFPDSWIYSLPNKYWAKFPPSGDLLKFK